MIRRAAKMQIEDETLHCVAFLGVDTEAGFFACGTCFFVQVIEKDMAFVYAITASHVIGSAHGETISVRVQRTSGAPRTFRTLNSDWMTHPDSTVDICLYPVDLVKWDTDDDLHIVALTWPSMAMTIAEAEQCGFGIGSDIFIPNVFTAALGEKQNLPVVRFGHVAAMAIEPIRFASPKRPAYLIETRSLGGMSGSPVIFHTDPARKGRRKPFKREADTGLLITPYFLVGILKGNWSGSYIDDFVGTDNMHSDAEFNSGLSVVLPVIDILEAIYQPRLCEQRRETVEAIRKSTGFKMLSETVLIRGISR
jgi:hypothetical protein